MSKYRRNLSAVLVKSSKSGIEESTMSSEDLKSTMEEENECREELIRKSINEELGPYLPIFQQALMKELGLLSEKDGTAKFLQRVIEVAALDKKLVAIDYNEYRFLQEELHALRFDFINLEYKFNMLSRQVSECCETVNFENNCEMSSSSQQKEELHTDRPKNPVKPY